MQLKAEVFQLKIDFSCNFLLKNELLTEFSTPRNSPPISLKVYFPRTVPTLIFKLALVGFSPIIELDD